MPVREHGRNRKGDIAEMSRELMITLLIVFPALAIANGYYFTGRLSRMIREMKVISSSLDMSRYRHDASLQMYAALAQIVLLTVPLLIYVYGALSHILRFWDLLYMLIPSVVVFAVGKSLKRTERRAWNMPADSAELERERDHVVNVWNTRPLPDWKD